MAMDTARNHNDWPIGLFCYLGVIMSESEYYTPDICIEKVKEWKKEKWTNGRCHVCNHDSWSFQTIPYIQQSLKTDGENIMLGDRGLQVMIGTCKNCTYMLMFNMHGRPDLYKKKESKIVKFAKFFKGKK